MGKASHKRREKERKTEWDRKPGETHLQWQSRITRKRQEDRDMTADIVSIHAAQHGKYEDEFIHHDETGTKTRTKRNKICSTLEKWIAEGGFGFDADAVSFIRGCQTKWEIIGNPRVTANYGERIHGASGDGMSQHMAKSDIARYKATLNAPQYWQIFENVVRFNQPAGIAGSDMASNPATRIASAKAVVGMVATSLAGKIAN
jgi:hypothetical protein